MGRGRPRLRASVPAERCALAQRERGDLQIAVPPTDRRLAELAAEVRRRLGPPPDLAEWPPVSVVVLNRDGAEHLRRLLDGLLTHTDYPHLELIVVDNGSTDDSLDFLRTVEAPFPVTLIANPHNESFSDACNQGAAAASGELLLFLNNDVEPFESGWLGELVACLVEGDAAAVGPTLIHPAGEGDPSSRYVVQQRGLRLREDAEGRLIPAYRDAGADPLGDGFGEEAGEAMAVIAACLLIERRAFDAVDGFTSGYWYGPEDLDLGLKLRERGMRARCSRRSLLVHPPNTTLGTIPSGLRREWMRGNRRLFARRWGPRVRREFELDRLGGGGLWAEPGTAPAPGRSRAQWEALGFCLRLAAPEGEGDGAEAALDALRAELARRDARNLALHGADVDALRGLEYDVAVHLKGNCRYEAPAPAQLNVLWGIDPSEEPDPAESSQYDLLATGADVTVLLAAIDTRVRETGFRTRISPVSADAVPRAHGILTRP